MLLVCAANSKFYQDMYAECNTIRIGYSNLRDITVVRQLCWLIYLMFSL